MLHRRVEIEKQDFRLKSTLWDKKVQATVQEELYSFSKTLSIHYLWEKKGLRI
jgi:hypothetical protein